VDTLSVGRLGFSSSTPLSCAGRESSTAVDELLGVRSWCSLRYSGLWSIDGSAAQKVPNHMLVYTLPGLSATLDPSCSHQIDIKVAVAHY